MLGLDVVKDAALQVAGGVEHDHLLFVSLGLVLSDFGLLRLPGLEFLDLAKDSLAVVFLLFAHFCFVSCDVFIAFD